MTPKSAAADGGPQRRKVVVTRSNEDREQLLRSGRASIARLALELRALRHAADVAEQSQDAVDPSIGGFDLTGARELLQSALSERVEARRAELATELDRARDDAARIVASAQRRADDYVGVAHDAVLLALQQPGEPLPPLPPLPPAVVSVEVEDRDVGVAADELAVADAPTLAVPAINGAAAAVADVTAIVAALQPYLNAAPAVTPAVAPPPAPAPRRPRPPLKQRVLHVDVLLPLIAVVVVLIVLLAWVG